MSNPDPTPTTDHLIADAERRWIVGLAAGPARDAVARTGPGPGDPAPNIELVDSDGGTVALDSFWADQPALIIFWRHFGCGCGADRAERLAAERDALSEAGATVVLVGMGDPTRTADYRERLGLAEPFLCDPERIAYQAYGVPEGTMHAVVYDDLDVLLGGEDAWRMVVDYKRDTGMHVADDGWQLMAEFVVGTDGTIRSAYRYQYCDNFPDPRFALSAIREAQAGLDPLRGSPVAEV